MIRWPLSLKHILVAVVLVILVVSLLGWKSGCDAAKKARAERDLAVVTGQQLDKVAEETGRVRAEQQEQEDEVERIEGADQPLPPGFGAELERVRRGGSDPRKP